MMKRQTAFEWNSYSPADGCTGLVRFIVWLNIFLQFLFPLAGAFTPAIVHAKHAVTASADAPGAATQVYTLGRGESVRSVAQKYHLTVEELRKLNQFRTFAHGFSGLQAGDELDVPVATAPSQKPASTPDNAPDEQQQKMAGLASQAGSFLSNGPDGQAAQSLVTGMATGEASGRLQQILSRYGTARVQLGMDDSFSLKNSQFDLLLPLWERQNALLFTQGSVHRTDDRTQSSLGLGLRYFADDRMVGGNTFLDYDLSRDHSRLGLGLEYGRDYLKLSANAYQRLSNWKDSPDVEDYQERPANGWDNAALSTVTFIAKDKFGNLITGMNKLTLAVKDSQEATPADGTVTVTALSESTTSPGTYTGTLKGTLAGVYTVTPLNDGATMAGLSATVTLTPGTTPDGVQSTFSASPTSIVADGTALSTLTFSAKDTFGNTITGLDKLTLAVKDSKNATPADGKVTTTALTESETTPGTYTATLKGTLADVYTVTVLNDTTAISGLSTTVTLTAGAPDGTTSTLTADPATITADDSTTSTLTFVAKDVFGNSITGLDKLTLGVKDSKAATPADGKVTTTALTESETTPGTYTATLKGQLADVYTVTVLNDTTAISGLSTTVTLTAGTTPDGTQSTLAASPASIVADDSAKSTLTFVAKDAFGNNITGLDKLTLAVKDSQDATPATGTVTTTALTESTTTPGMYTATLKGQVVDVYTVTVLNDTTAISGVSTTVTLTAGEPDATQSTISLSPKSIKADDTETTTVTIVLKDVSGNAVSGYDPATGNSRLSTKVYGSDGEAVVGTLITQGPLKESTTTQGTYTRTLKGKAVDTLTVRPTIDGENLGDVKDTVTLVPLSFKDITVNGYTFATGSGFPTTGYSGATFTVNMPAGKSATDYDWASSQSSWVTVSTAGVVTFSGIPTSETKQVMITATPKAGGPSLGYSFTLANWFTFGGVVSITYDGAVDYCTQNGWVVPDPGQVTNSTVDYQAGTRSIGPLWSEWGDLKRKVGSRSDMYSWVTPGLSLVRSSDGMYWKSYGNNFSMPNIEALCRKSL